MDLKSNLQILHAVSLKEHTSPPFIVGGLVRDRVIGNLKTDFNDIDLTTGDNSVFQLAKEFGIELKKYTPLVTKQAEDKHISVITKDFKFDFSSNFTVPGIDSILLDKGIKPTSMLREIWSRDFTINTLLMSIDFRKIKDLTGMGIKDIKFRILRTCLSPELTFKYNVKRIVRVIYLSAKLGFEVHPHIIEWITKNPQYIMKCDNEYLAKNINNALKYNPTITVNLINKMNLWNYLPITAELYPYWQKFGV